MKTEDLRELKVGDIISIRLSTDDGLTLSGEYRTRRKFVVIIGFTPEGEAIGILLVNTSVDTTKRSRELLDAQYPLLRRFYPEFLVHDSWLDCSDIFEILKMRLESEETVVVSHLSDEDLERVLDYLRSSDLFDRATKRRYGLL